MLFDDIYDSGDFCLRASLYASGKIMLNDYTSYDKLMFSYMEVDCNLKSMRPRKSSRYIWSISDGLTKWLYDHVLKYIMLDPFKGLNFDQMRSLYIYVFLNGDWKQALRAKLWLILRGGLAPSLMEHVLAKPQSCVLLLKTKYPFNLQYLWYPLYLVSKFFFWLSVKRELKIPCSVSTTNKISLLPTMYLLGFKMPDGEFIKNTYQTYFKSNIIGKVLTEALTRR